MLAGSPIPLIAAAALAPLMQGVIVRTKSVMAGRAGQPLMQPYRELWKLLHKGAVYSDTTSWIFRIGPAVGLVSLMLAMTLIPFGGFPALSAFSGDFVLIAYLMALG